MTKACDETKIGLRNRTIILTLLDIDVRASELTGFQMDDLDLLNGTLAVRAKNSKTHQSRAVFFARGTRQSLNRYLRSRGKLPGPLFEARSHQRGL